MSDPIKSSGLILLKPQNDLEKNEYFDYEFLCLKRFSTKKKSRLSFPIAQITHDDTELLKSNFKDFALLADELNDINLMLTKLSALRYLYEEMGLLFIPNQLKLDDIQNNYLSLAKFTEISKLSFLDIVSKLELNFNLNEEDITEFIRLVSPSDYKTRSDTQYLIFKPSQKRFLNVNFIALGIDIFSIDKILMKSQNMICQWSNPSKMLKLHIGREVDLDIPEFFLSNILVSFKSAIKLDDYLKKIQYDCLNTQPENLIEKKTLTFPFNLAITKNYDYILNKNGISQIMYFESDFNYPFLETLKAQNQGKWREELKSYYEKVSNSESDQLRFLFKKNSRIPWLPFEVITNLNYEIPLKLIKGFLQIKGSIGYGSL